MMRLLHRWADTQLRAEVERLTYARDQARRVARSMRDQRDDARYALAEMKKEQHQ